jgi:hypothetical protein
MRKSSQKLTKEKSTASKGVSTLVERVSEKWVTPSVTSGRFAGMAKNTEKLDALVIPGYKIRG